MYQQIDNLTSYGLLNSLHTEPYLGHQLLDTSTRFFGSFSKVNSALNKVFILIKLTQQKYNLAYKTIQQSELNFL